MKHILILAIISLMLSIPAFSQGIQPEHFLWLGAGIDGFNKTAPIGNAGYGQRVGDGFYLLMNLTMRGSSSSIDAVPIKHIAEAGPVELFALGEIGISTGQDITKANFGGGGGVNLDVIRRLNPKLENWRLTAAVKIEKPNPGADGTSTVKPTFYGGLTYYLK
jgi:hypothetical protein